MDILYDIDDISDIPSGMNISDIQYDVSTFTVAQFYYYQPSLLLVCVSLSVFALAGVAMTILTEKYRRRFVHLISFTALCEALGYASLIVSIERSGKGDIYPFYVMTQVLVVLAPNLIQAAEYWKVGIVLSSSPELTRGRKMLSGKFITIFFACSDLFALGVQAVGISIWAKSQASGIPNPDTVRRGSAITLVGLGIQLFSFFIFTVLAIWTHHNAKMGLRNRPETKSLFCGMYITMAFLYIRNIFRFVSFTQNTLMEWPPSPTTYVLSHQEVLFYCLDAIPIAIIFLTYILLHPGRLLPAKGNGTTMTLRVDDLEMAAPRGQFMVTPLV